MSLRSVHFINLNIKKLKSFQKNLQNSSLQMEILQQFAKIILTNHQNQQQYFTEFIFANWDQIHKIKINKINPTKVNYCKN